MMHLFCITVELGQILKKKKALLKNMLCVLYNLIYSETLWLFIEVTLCQSDSCLAKYQRAFQD